MGPIKGEKRKEGSVCVCGRGGGGSIREGVRTRATMCIPLSFWSNLPMTGSLGTDALLH